MIKMIFSAESGLAELNLTIIPQNEILDSKLVLVVWIYFWRAGKYHDLQYLYGYHSDQFDIILKVVLNNVIILALKTSIL